MKLFQKSVLLAMLLMLISACSSKDDDQPLPSEVIRDYATQYSEDILKIEEYLKTHSVTIVNNPGFPDDQDITYAEVPKFSPESIWGSNVNIPKESLLFKNVTVAGVVHKAYYLKFRNGIGASPSINNNIKAYYQVISFDDFIFQTAPAAGQILSMDELILGWQAILPEFKAGTTTGNKHEDFGAGAMFLPSALVYYNHSVGMIPRYTPLIFNIKLFDVM